ncbi:hypothetical protein DAMA08_022390 [Martiniozyma asiatica (nom. inval.)]|nr:hypothetical protein DAMA08_022390 [Martiniozyma asiatica]
MVTKADSYTVALEKSLELSLQTLEKLKNENVRDDPVQMALSQKDLILDSVRLIKAKDEFKNEFNKETDLYNDQMKSSINLLKNPLLGKYRDSVIANDSIKMEIKKAVSRMPEINVKPLLEDNDINSVIHDIFKSLDKTKDEIENLFLSTNQSPEIENKIKDLDFPNTVLEELKNSLLENDIQKFKLIKLHDGFLASQRQQLLDMDRKWSNELIKVKQFVKGDIGRFTSDLKAMITKEQDSEIKDTNADKDEFDDFEDLAVDAVVESAVEDSDESMSEKDSEEKLDDDAEREQKEEQEPEDEEQEQELEQEPEQTEENHPLEKDISETPEHFETLIEGSSTEETKDTNTEDNSPAITDADGIDEDIEM